MAKIEKIYQITLEGEQDLLKKMNAVNKSFEIQKKLFQEVKTASKGVLSNSEELAREKQALQQVTVELVKQQAEAKKLRAETISLQNAKRVLSNEELKNQQAALKSYEAYQKLSRQYTEARKNAQGIGAMYGVNSAQFQKASAEAAKLQNQLYEIDQGVRVFTRNVGNYPNAMVRNFSDAMRQNFADLKNQMATFALGYLSFQGAMDISSRIKNDVIAFDSLNKSIEAVSERTGDYAQNQKFLEEVSERLGLKILDTSKNFKTFFASFTEAGGAAQDARDIFEAASESSANLRLSQEQTNGVMLAFGQIASKGKVQAEELRGQIGERIPGAFGIAARAMNMTTAELDKAMSKGEIYSKDFLPKFAAELKKTFGTGGEEVTGLNAQLNRLDNMVAKIGSNQSFITTVTAMVDVILFLASSVSKVPWSVWLSFVGFLTIAYWASIQALVAKNAALAGYVIRMGVGNTLILAATVLEKGHAAALFLVNGAYKLLIVTLELFGVSTVKIRALWISFNAVLFATPWGMVLSLIAAVGAATVVFAQRTEDATVKLKEHGKTIVQNTNYIKANNDITQRSSDLISGTMAKVKQHTAVLNDENASLNTKKTALQQLIDINPTYLKGLTLENYHTAQGVKILDDYKNKLLEVARAKGAKDFLEEQYRKQFENESTRQGRVDEANRISNSGFFSWERTRDSFQSMAGDVGIGSGGAYDRFEQGEKEAKEISDKIKYAEGLVSGFTEKGLYDDDYMNSLLGGAADPAKVVVPDGKTKTYRGSRLTGNQRDFLKDLEADRNKELAILETSFNKGELLEEEYIRKSLAVNIRYHDEKIKYLKAGNAEERKQEAKALLDRAKDISEANNRIYNLRKKGYDQELKLADDTAKNNLDKVMNDPYSNEHQRIEAQTKFHDDSTAAQLIYNQKMMDLETQLSKNMIHEVNERGQILQQRIDAQNRNSLQSKFDTLNADVTSVDNVKEQVDNQNEINAAVARRNILGNTRLNQQQKELELERINADLSLKNTNAELGAVIAKIALYDSLVASGVKLTEEMQKQYDLLLKQKAVMEQQKAEGEQAVNNAKAKSAASGVPGNGMSGLANVATKAATGPDGKLTIGGTDVSAQAAHAIGEAFSMAEQAMNRYFDAERQRIEQSRQLAYQRIDLEREQSLRYAQSTAEREAIDKEAAEKKRRADKKAGEQLKKQKKNEAKIAFFMELANIWSTVWSIGNPIAAVIMGGVLSLLAGVRYAQTVKSIDETKYARGGKFSRGGKLTGPSHSENNGMPVLNPVTGQTQAYMEGGEGIINKRSMSDGNVYSVSGTPSQIASKINAMGGGVDWMGGATLKKFASGGVFNWGRAEPPVFNSQSQQFESGNMESYVSDRINRIEASVEALAQEGFKKVVLNPNEVTSYQRERNKQTEIGVL